MAAAFWGAADSGDWSNPGNWSTDTVSDAATPVTISRLGHYTVTVSTDEAAKTLRLADKQTATLAIAATLSVGNLVDQKPTVLALGAGGVLSVLGNATFAAAANAPATTTIDGPGTLLTAGRTMLGDSGVALLMGGGADWINTGTADSFGAIELQAQATSTITNAAGAVLNLATASIQVTQFNNAGTLAKQTATGTVTIQTDHLDETGTLRIDGGVLQITLEGGGGGNELGGRIVGDGTLEIFGDQASTLDAAINASLVLLGSYKLDHRIEVGAGTTQAVTITNEGRIDLDGAGATLAGALGRSTTLQNDGALRKNGGGLSRVTTVVDNGYGRIEIESGTLVLPHLANYANGALTGGHYLLRGVLELGHDQPLTTIGAQTEVALDRIGADIRSLDTATGRQQGIERTLATIDHGGTLELSHHYTFDTGGILYDNGVLFVRKGSHVAHHGIVVGQGGGLVGDGTIDSALRNHGRVTALAGGRLTLDGRVSAGGTFEAEQGSVLRLADVAAGIFNDGTLEHGHFLAKGSIELSGGRIVVDAANILLAGGDMQHLASTLATIAATGVLGIEESFDLTAHGGRLSVEGQLKLDYGGTIEATLLSVGNAGTVEGSGRIESNVALDGGVLAASGYFFESLEVDGALRGTGLIEALPIYTYEPVTLDLHGGGAFAGTFEGLGVVEITGTDTFTLLQPSLDQARNLIQQGPARVVLGQGASLTVAAGSTYEVQGGVMAGGSGASLINDGTVETTGSSTIGVAVVDEGSVGVTGTLSFSDAVSGNGTVVLYQSASATFMQSVGSGVSVDLQAYSTLDLARPLAFDGTIDFFTKHETIDLLGAPATSARFSDGVLTVRDGPKLVASLSFGGPLRTSAFLLSSDGHGGTFITHR